MNHQKIWLSSPHLGGTEMNYIQEAFAANWIAPLGPNVDGLEQDLSRFLGHGYVAALSSGTAALHLALILSGVGPGDEVLCQSFTFSASANPIRYQYATPVFIDSESTTWNLCPEALEEAILDRIRQGKKPKACIAVHLYGMPAQIDRIQALCQQHGIVLIEDAAEALGSTFQGKALGTWGDFGILSFNGNKIITTSGGGALVCQQPELAQKARFLATQARDAAPHYQHSEIGYNYRMSNIAAGIGRGQMEVLPQWVQLRRAHHEVYSTELPQLHWLPEPTEAFSNRWLSCALFATEELREQARLALEAHNIESRPLWKPMHLQPVFAEFPYYGTTVAADLFERGLCLPSGSNLAPADRARVIQVLQSLS